MKENKMGEIYYKKVGRRYVPVSEEFTGFPKEGVWIVSTKGEKGRWSGYWMMHLGATPSVMVAAAFAKYRDVVASAVMNIQNWPSRSPMDIAQAVITAVACAEQEQSNI